MAQERLETDKVNRAAALASLAIYATYVYEDGQQYNRRTSDLFLSVGMLLRPTPVLLGPRAAAVTKEWVLKLLTNTSQLFRRQL